MSHPTYINSSTSISEPIKPFDGLDHNYTPEEYLQHIEARVTFSQGVYNLHRNMIIKFDTPVAWLSYNAL